MPTTVAYKRSLRSFKVSLPNEREFERKPRREEARNIKNNKVLSLPLLVPQNFLSSFKIRNNVDHRNALAKVVYLSFSGYSSMKVHFQD